jgi:hypothetical protein
MTPRLFTTVGKTSIVLAGVLAISGCYTSLQTRDASGSGSSSYDGQPTKTDGVLLTDAPAPADGTGSTIDVAHGSGGAGGAFAPAGGAIMPADANQGGAGGAPSGGAGGVPSSGAGGVAATGGGGRGDGRGWCGRQSSRGHPDCQWGNTTCRRAIRLATGRPDGRLQLRRAHLQRDLRQQQRFGNLWPDGVCHGLPAAHRRIRDLQRDRVRPELSGRCTALRGSVHRANRPLCREMHRWPAILCEQQHLHRCVCLLLVQRLLRFKTLLLRGDMCRMHFRFPMWHQQSLQ